MTGEPRDDSREIFKVLALSIGAAVAYGISHDLVTTRVCLEYFTINHPPIFGGTRSPTLLALGWGVIATWWMGAILGLPLALIARLGERPRLGAGALVRPIAGLLLIMAALSLGAGVVGFCVEQANPAIFDEILWRISKGQRAPFNADLFAHMMAYAAGGVGGIVLWVVTWRRRGILARDVAAH